jgi:hypothetical protein
MSEPGRAAAGAQSYRPPENGRHYYAMHGRQISPPRDELSGPSREALAWHQTNSFLG